MQYLYNTHFQNAFDLFDTLSSSYRTQFKLREEEGCYYLDLDLPGFTKKDIKISVAHDKLRLLTTSATRPNIEKEIALPLDIDSSAVKASLRNGVLVIELSKSQEKLAREIKITS